MKFSIAAFLSAIVAVASAYTPPVGEPKGNPIFTPGLNQQVPVGKPFKITWNPTTEGTVSILLLRGPTENVVYHSTIVEGIQNSGSYEWTPSTALEADTARYGIQLIVDGTGQYQYSTQFGIQNDGSVRPTTTDVPTTTTGSTTTKPTTTSKPTTTTTSTTSSTNSTTTTATTSKPTTLTTTTASNTTTTKATTTKATTTTIEEEDEEETATPTTTKVPTATNSPTQQDSAAGKAVGSFGIAAIAAGAFAISFF